MWRIAKTGANTEGYCIPGCGHGVTGANAGPVDSLSCSVEGLGKGCISTRDLDPYQTALRVPPGLGGMVPPIGGVGGLSATPCTSMHGTLQP